MAAKLEVMTVKVQGMTCTNCEHHIESGLLGQAGVLAVKARYTTAQVRIEFDSTIISRRQLADALSQMDYPVVQPVDAPKLKSPTDNRAQQSRGQSPARQATTAHSAQKSQRGQLLGMAIILVALFLVLRKLGVTDLFNVFPQAEAGMGYGLLFVIGLLTSVHCIAMCGGINLSQCMPQTRRLADSPAGEDAPTRGQTLMPSLLYNAGRVVSYTLIGGLVGALGSVLILPGRAKGLIALIAGIFMVIMGLNMLQVFPSLRKFNPRLPRPLAALIYKERQRGNKGPFTIGLLNGLMPCGPLQAMQLYALSTGSPLEGALSMLLFSLGTVPLMFGLGALSTLLSRRFTQKMMQASAMLVIVLGIFMFQNGLGLSGVSVAALTSSVLKPSANSQGQSSLAQSQIVDGVQVITTELASNAYAPIKVQAGIPVRWNLHAAQGTINGCNNAIVIPAYGIEKALEVGDNFIEFTPDQSGIVPFSCWMGMIRSQITVVDDLALPDTQTQNVIQTGAAKLPAGCCSVGGSAGATTGQSGQSDASGLPAGCCG